MRNNKGQIADLFVWLAVGFAMVVVGVVVVFSVNVLTTALTTGPELNNAVNLTAPAKVVFGNINAGVQQFTWLSFVLFIVLGLSIFASNFLVRANPFFYVAYIFVVIIAIVFSIFISNGYSNLVDTSGILQETFKSFVGMHYIMLHLPIWTTVIGIGGAIFLFIGMSRDDELGGGLV